MFDYSKYSIRKTKKTDKSCLQCPMGQRQKYIKGHNNRNKLMD